MKRERMGLWMVLISGIAFGIMPSAVTFCYEQGATSALMVLLRYLMLFLVLLPFVLRQKNTMRIYRRNFVRIFVLSLAGAATPLLLYTAYFHLSTGMTTTVHFLYPAMVALISVIFFRVKLSVKTLLCLVLCVGGVLLMLDPSGKWSAFGLMIAFLSSVTWALYIVLLDQFRIEGVSSEQMIFYIAMNSFIIILIYGLCTGSLSFELTPVGWLGALATSLVIAVLGSLFFAMGVRHTDAQVSAIASTLEPITCIVVGVLFLHEPISVRAGIGAALILTAVILLSVGKKKQA